MSNIEISKLNDCSQDNSVDMDVLLLDINPYETT